MGFEWLLIAASRNLSVLENIVGMHNISLPLHFTPAAKKSKLFADASASLMADLATRNITFNFHSYGITAASFARTEMLASFFSVLSTNVDQVGQTFVSTIEAYDYPIYGTQWHPEKNAFE